MLVIILVLAVGLAVGIIKERKDPYGKCWPFFLAASCGTLLALILIIWPINYSANISSIEQYYATKQTIEIARTKETDEIERAALTQEIINTNQWLARVQYWNRTIFGMYIPDKVMELEPLR